MQGARKELLVRIGIGLAAAALIAWVLGVFVVPASGSLQLELGGEAIDLLAPSWLYLVVLVPYFFVAVSYSLTDLSTVQQHLQAGFRSLLIAGIAVALARPVTTSTDDKVATAILIDVSESVSDAQLEAAREHARSVIAARRADDRVYLVTFAERPQLVKGGEVDGIARHEGRGAGTNIQAAVQLAYGLYPEGYLPRMLILSDGNQTHGDLMAEAYRAEEMGVVVSYKSFPKGQQQEVRVASLRLPDEIKVGAPFEVKAEIWASHPDEVTVHLSQDDFPNGLQPVQTVKLSEGTNWVTFKSQAKRAGHTTYRLRLSGVERDTEKANNASVMTAPVKGRPRVLYVEGGVQREPSSAGYLERALEHENIDVEVRGPRGLPSTAKELERFDLVLVSDVPAHFMGLAQMQALESYVRDLGGGLIMSGGEDSFGSGGYQGTRIEKIMPVRFDGEKEREQPNVAIVLVIDRSGSMSGAKLEAAKESARATAEVLSASDLIGVIAFDQSPTMLVRMQRAANRMRISADISRLMAGGGTDIRPALREAYEVLQTTNAKVKHVILLSDGNAPYEGIAELAQDMRASRITVSAVGIGDADRNLLQLVVDNGDGRLYMTDDLAALPRIFMKETTEAQKSTLVEELVRAHVAKRVEMIEGTGVESAPPLHGYVSTKPKPTSEVVLVSDLGEPLLARWRLGTGSSVAWTSDVKNRWSVEWIRWGGFPKFWAQVVRTSMRRKVYDSYDLSAEVVDGIARVVVDAIDAQDQFVNELDTTLEIVDPKTSKAVREVPMVQSAAGRYVAEFSVDRYGSYLLKAVHQREGKTVAESTGSVALPYPAEYQDSSPDLEALAHAATVTGGSADPPPPALFDPRDQSIAYTRDLWPWVLLFVAGALVLDTFLKRLRLFGHRTLRFQ